MLNTWQSLADSLTVNDALAKLADTEFGVVFDRTGVPVAVVNAAALTSVQQDDPSNLADPKAALSLSVITGSEISMDELLQSGAGTHLLVGDSLGAVVIGEDDGIVGILPAKHLKEYLAGPGRALALDVRRAAPGMDAGDTSLSGSRTTPVGLIRCAMCGFINKVAFYDSEHPPRCANPQPHFAVGLHDLIR
jgi:hypothetical protein